MTVLLVSHEPEARAHADRVLRIVDGRLAGSPARGGAQPRASATRRRVTHQAG
jgi:ABC-type lipoprotein export system ATPase subunit